MRSVVTGLAVALTLVLGGQAGATPSTGFGNQWVRNHPFTLKGLNIFAANLEVGEYNGAGFTTAI